MLLDTLNDNELWTIITHHEGTRLFARYRKMLADIGIQAVKLDIWRVYAAVPDEVARFVPYITEGKIDGQIYTTRPCRCLKGTLGYLSGVPLPDQYDEDFCNYLDLHDQLTDFWLERGIALGFREPSELFVSRIRVGDTPASEPASQLLLRWTLEWLGNTQPVSYQQQTLTEQG